MAHNNPVMQLFVWLCLFVFGYCYRMVKEDTGDKEGQHEGILINAIQEPIIGGEVRNVFNIHKDVTFTSFLTELVEKGALNLEGKNAILYTSNVQDDPPVQLFIPVQNSNKYDQFIMPDLRHIHFARPTPTTMASLR